MKCAIVQRKVTGVEVGRMGTVQFDKPNISVVL